MLGDDLIRGANAASKFLGGVISPGQVYRLSASGEIPSVKKAGVLYFRKSELEAAFRTGSPADRDAA